LDRNNIDLILQILHSITYTVRMVVAKHMRVSYTHVFCDNHAL